MAVQRVSRREAPATQVGSRGLSVAIRASAVEQAAKTTVFPLAFPLTAGLGRLSADRPARGRATSWAADIAVFASLLLCLALTYRAMRLSKPLTRCLGKTGGDVVGRVSAVLLAALAVRFVFDGLRQAGL
jgi:multiple antibiotic resistance protein